MKQTKRKRKNEQHECWPTWKKPLMPLFTEALEHPKGHRLHRVVLPMANLTTTEERVKTRRLTLKVRVRKVGRKRAKLKMPHI